MPDALFTNMYSEPVAGQYRYFIGHGVRHDAVNGSAPFSQTVCRAALKRGFLDCSSTAPFSSRIQVSDSAASCPLRSRITRAPWPHPGGGP